MEIQTFAPKITIDSREVAKMLDKRHADLMRDIRGYKNDLDQNANLRSDDFFIESVYKAGTGKEYSCYLLTKAGCEFVANKMTGKKGNIFTAEYIQKFNEMESSTGPAHIKLPQTPMETLELMFKAQKQTDDKVNKVDERMDKFEENQMLNPGEYNYLSRRINRTVSQYIELHHMVLNVGQRSKLFKDINRQVNEVAGIKTRTQLRKKHFETVDKFITNWSPSASTLELVKMTELAN